MMRIRSFLFSCAVFVSILVLPTASHAQDEPLLEQLRSQFKREYFDLSVVTRVQGRLQFDPDEATNGFDIPAARLLLRGTLDEGFNYFVQTNFTSSPALLDARLGYRFSETLALETGLTKSPFSAEFLTSLPDIDLIDRSLAVSNLAPNRQIGVTLNGNNLEQTFSYSIGVYNGNGRSLNGNDNNTLLYVGRLVAFPSLSDGTLELGINAAFSEDGSAASGQSRFLFGGDFRFEKEPIFLSGEVIYSELDPNPAFLESRNPFGYQATAGYMLKPDTHQLLFRLDGFNPDMVDDEDLTFLIFGYNFFPTQVFEIRVNYLLPLHDSDAGNHTILINFQLAF